MTAPAFGFSAGDFVAVITVIIDVSRALKDAGGASDEYRSVINELSLLRNALGQLQLKTNRGNNPFNEFVKQQLDMTLLTLSEFLSLISKFEGALGSQAPSGWHRGVRRKAQWALKYTKQVDKLRKHVGMQVQVLNTLLLALEDQTNNPDPLLSQAIISLKDQGSQVSSIQRDIIQNFKILGDKTSISNTAHQSALQSIQQTIDHGLTRNNRELTQFQRVATRNANTVQGSIDNLERAVNTEISCLRSSIVGSMSLTQSRLDSITVSQEFVENTMSMKLEDLSLKLTNLHSSIEEKLPDPTHHELRLREAIQSQQLCESQSVGVPEDMKKLISALAIALIKSLGNLILQLWWYLPQLIHLMSELANTIRREPLLLVSDSINFEDVLGREFTLQFGYFRHRVNFEAFMIRHFRDLPGERHVKMGKYYILDSIKHGLIIPWDDWDKSIVPGRRISMSIEVGSLKASLKKCPRPGCSGKIERVEGQPTLLCPICNLKCFQTPNQRLSNATDSLIDIPEESKSYSTISRKAILFSTSWVTGRRKETASRVVDDEVREKSEIMAFRRVHLAIADEGSKERTENWQSGKKDANFLKITHRKDQFASRGERFSTQSLSLVELAEAILKQTENGGIQFKNRRWHLRVYYNSFTGSDMTTWLLDNFEDIETREEAVEFGNKLMVPSINNVQDGEKDDFLDTMMTGVGLFTHVENRHPFRDGQYFYQISAEYSKPLNRFFRQSQN